ncbi:TRAF-like protein [Artemisia annua]|uniref:TRAF-like protein n=1 Tax=Artemisia annua TaxID=35608 RepID=A0A2U1M6K6_ARTAN|nr:TRAF-like protein [Artemisia annua]
MGPDTFPEKPNNKHILKPLTFGKSQSGVMNEGEYGYYEFSIDDDTWGIISQGDIEIKVKLDSEAKDGDTDLYLSQHPLLFPNTHQHGWSSHDMGPKCLVLGSNTKPWVQGCGIVLRTEDVKNQVHCEKCGLAFHSEEIEKHMKKVSADESRVDVTEIGTIFGDSVVTALIIGKECFLLGKRIAAPPPFVQDVRRCYSRSEARHSREHGHKILKKVQKSLEILDDMENQTFQV